MKSFCAAIVFLCIWTAPSAALAQVHKCQLPDGQIEYRSIPCGPVKEVAAHEANLAVSRGTPPLAVAEGRARECNTRQMRIHFADMPVRATFQVVADFAGQRLVLDPSINGKGAYHYDCLEWDAVLQDMAKRHGLVVKVEDNVIRVTRPERSASK